ncbi:Protein-export protein SecB (maintains pre-export unfolded state) [hydrothermal vent metagenome]|uniref:Protein-export protein SecB (Maintains pre-export unfolded state) n=1 Tax=hydrothermal vent metagenome TaxID=652676 RepID=A0A3B0RYA7_9ZZZZ
MSDTNDTAAQPSETSTEPQLRVLTQYIKDLSFENPNAPTSLQGGEAPTIDMQIGVNIDPVQDGVWEVGLPIVVTAKRGDDVLFLVEILYCGLFVLENIPAEGMEPMLHIECPRLLFPYARQIISGVTQDGGFPALSLEPIDFSAVYRTRLQRLEQQNAAENNGAVPDEKN